MISPGSELRILGAAAALGGLLVTMCAAEPSVASLSCGLVGLAVFGVSSLAARLRLVAEAGIPADEPTLASPPPDGATRGVAQDASVGATPSDLPAALRRTARVKPFPRQATTSSLLPPSRALRSPATR